MLPQDDLARLELTGLTDSAQEVFHFPRAEAPGSYARLLPCPKPVHVPKDQNWLKALRERAERLVGDTESLGIPAGYTYFGQLLAHDLSFRTEFGHDLDGAIEPVNLRTPLLDLDVLYGGGPRVRPDLYDPRRLGRFLIGGVENRMLARRIAGGAGAPRPMPAPTQRDLFRTWHSKGPARALIPDPRNDENVMLSQLHLRLQLAHNAVLDRMNELGFPDSMRLFRAARAFLVAVVQNVTLRDYLPRVLDPPRCQRLNAILSGGSVRYALRGVPGVEFEPGKIPLEFVFAVFRFGHGMVRGSYVLNRHRDSIRLMPLDWEHPNRNHLGGGRELLPGWEIDWRFFLEFDWARYGMANDPVAPYRREDCPQRARRIGPNVARDLTNLPPDAGAVIPDPFGGRKLLRVHSLPVLTLMSAWALQLPSGAQVATQLGEQPIDGSDDSFLWEYVLREARDGGLGPVASTIVLDVLLGTITRSAAWLSQVPNLHAVRELADLPSLVYLDQELAGGRMDVALRHVAAGTYL